MTPVKTPTEKPDDAGRVEVARRILRDSLVGLVPVLFVGFFLMNVEGVNGDCPLFSGTVPIFALAQRLLMLALAVVVTGVAGLFGMRLLRLAGVRPGRLFARLILGVGLGLGTIALATLALGSAGLIGPAASVLTLGAMFLVGIVELRDVGNFLRAKERPRFAPLSFVELALVMALLVAFLFLLTLAFNVPTDYDACEYHLAAPARWFQLGRIDFITGNVFSNLPMNCEMLYLFSMGLCGEMMLGVHLSVVMNAMTALLAAGAVYALARKLFTRPAALAATALFATMPWVLYLTTVNVYNEMLLTFYVTLAVLAFLEVTDDGAGVRWLVLSAVFAGLAAGVKYTALAFLPVAGLVGALVVFRTPRRKALGLVYVLVVLLVVAPWLVKNVACTGNPVYPFAWGVFGGRDWSPEQAEKWIAAQEIAAGAERAGNLALAFWNRVVTNVFSSVPLAVFVVLGVVRWRRERAMWGLVALVALWTLFWYFFTHRVDRFWFPMMGVSAALAGGGLELFRDRRLRLVLAAVLVGALAWQLYLDSILWRHEVTGSFDLRIGNDRLLFESYMPYAAARFAHTLDRSQRMMLVGEAQTLYFPPNVVTSTVFDREVFTTTVGDVGDAETVRRRLREAGVTHVFVNWFEAGRLRGSYTWTDARGDVRPGFPALSPRDFAALVDARVLEEVWTLDDVPRNDDGTPKPLRGLTPDD
ncbi:MAG TPA: glycosyltransferase family 39 protein, partial [Planctomycetota bacterium]|nr:glycosyltransferase family 39 protein [Planctomycetota bacterium]